MSLLAGQRNGTDAAGCGAAEPDVALVQGHAVDFGVGHVNRGPDLSGGGIELVDLAHPDVGTPEVTLGDEDAMRAVTGGGNGSVRVHGAGINQKELLCRRHGHPHVALVQPLQAMGARHQGVYAGSTKATTPLPGVS